MATVLFVTKWWTIIVVFTDQQEWNQLETVVTHVGWNIPSDNYITQQGCIVVILRSL